MIGRTNAGGGGVGATLTVSAPVNIVVSVKKGSKIKRKTSNASGLAVFKGLESGVWTVEIYNGTQTTTKPVTIIADYNTVIAFFMATINVTYPAGSACTCTDGSTILTAPDKTGSWQCTVPNAGTWIVQCSDGVDTDSESVNITTDGQSVSVELAYWNGELYDNGNQFEWLTGGWTAHTQNGTAYTFGTDSIQFGGGGSGTIYTNQTIDVSGYSALHADITITNSGKSIELGLSSKNTTINADYRVVNTGLNSPTAKRQQIDVDISAINGNYYAHFSCWQSGGQIHKIWIE